MVKESLLLFGLDDISAIRFTCKTCQASMCLTKGHALPNRLQCVQCRTPLAADEAVYKVVSGFIDGLNAARTMQSDTLEMRFVFKED